VSACAHAAVLVLGLIGATGASAAPSFSARGSAEQVYVTGVAPSAQMSLITPAGTTLYTQQADSLGGLLFRKVPPGTGYRVRLASGGAESEPITVHSDAAKPAVAEMRKRHAAPLLKFLGELEEDEADRFIEHLSRLIAHIRSG